MATSSSSSSSFSGASLGSTSAAGSLLAVVMGFRAYRVYTDPPKRMQGTIDGPVISMTVACLSSYMVAKGSFSTKGQSHTYSVVRVDGNEYSLLWHLENPERLTLDP